MEKKPIRNKRMTDEESVLLKVGDIETKSIRKSNSLVEARYRLTLGEQRILYLLASAINPSDEDFKKYRISIKDLAEVFSIPYCGDLIEQVMDSLDRLRIRKFQPYEDDLKEKYGKRSFALLGWISQAEYKNGEASVEVKFAEQLKPYYLKLKERFTQIPFNVIVYLKSQYAIRFYEMLKEESFKANQEGYFKRSFEYEELRYKFLIEENEYKFFKDFRVYVIEPAVKEINESSDINIFQLDYAKTGRKFTHIVFHCQKKQIERKQLSYDKEGSGITVIEKKKKQKESPLEVRELVSFGIDEQTAYKWRKKYGVKNITRNIAYTKAMQRDGKIRNSISGFLCKAITDNLGGAWEAEQEQIQKKRKAYEDAEAKKKKEELALAEESKRKSKAVLEWFEALPAEEQKTIREDFEKQLNSIVLPFWQTAKMKNPERPELHPTVKATFLVYVQKVKPLWVLDT